MRQTEILHKLQSMQGELDALKASVAKLAGKENWRSMAGVFENDPVFERAMKYGREYRQSLRPKSRRRNKKR